ncbi:threonylcarbamoyl-AMP synthase [bacterium]|nr:threonylcarbamoyl-AMP synthase [bacterium]
MDVAEAVERLGKGQPVAIPTETVYGLAADASQPAAVARVFELKGRPADHPLIVHLGDASWATSWGHLPPPFDSLAQRFWPGPLTLVVPRLDWVDPLITGGQSTVALRVPRHPLALQVLQRLGRGLVAPSANRFGHTSPTTAQHVRDEFGEEVAVLDGGPCLVGVESTILDLSGPRPRILRPGQLSRADLEAVVGELDQLVGEVPRVPGSLDRHYAPRTFTRLGGGEQPPPGRWGWLGFSPRGASHEVIVPANATDYAQRLYSALRELDRAGLEIILVEPPPQTPEWEAVWDRLRRATRS